MIKRILQAPKDTILGLATIIFLIFLALFSKEFEDFLIEMEMDVRD